jgi:hypothetical protein
VRDYALGMQVAYPVAEKLQPDRGVLRPSAALASVVLLTLRCRRRSQRRGCRSRRSSHPPTAIVRVVRAT